MRPLITIPKRADHPLLLDRKILVISPPAYKPIRLYAYQFGNKTSFQVYPLLDISTLQLLYSNYLHESTLHWLK